MINNSDTPIQQLTFRSSTAQFTDYSHYDEKTGNFPRKPAATPRPVLLHFLLLPNTEKDIQFLTCSATPPPGGPYDFDVTPAKRHEFVWLTGYTGRTCLGSEC